MMLVISAGGSATPGGVTDSLGYGVGGETGFLCRGHLKHTGQYMNDDQRLTNWREEGRMPATYAGSTITHW